MIKFILATVVFTIVVIELGHSPPVPLKTKRRAPPSSEELHHLNNKYFDVKSAITSVLRATVSYISYNYYVYIAIAIAITSKYKKISTS